MILEEGETTNGTYVLYPPGLTDAACVQEEPQNVDPWTFIAPRLAPLLPPSLPLRYSAAPSASPATGDATVRKRELAELLHQAFAE